MISILIRQRPKNIGTNFDWTLNINKCICIAGFQSSRISFTLREGFKKKVIFITLGSDPPPLKSDNHFFGN